MALPPLLVTALSAAATSPKVQQVAERLLSDVYGRFVTPYFGRTKDDLTELTEATLAEAATKEEVAASFAVLQAEIDNRIQNAVAGVTEQIAASFAQLQAEMQTRHQRSMLLIGAIMAFQILVIALLVI